MRKLLLLLCTLVLIHTFRAQIPWRVAQDTQTVYNKKDLMFFAAPVYSDLESESRKKDPYAISSGTLNFNLGVNYCIYFKKRFGFNFGLEYSNYTNITLYRGAFRLEEPKVDKDGYLFLPVRECNLKERRMVGAVEIPLLFRYRSNSGLERASFFIDAGLKGHVMAVSTLKQEGSLESKGAYLLQGFSHSYFLDEKNPSYGYVVTTYNENKNMKVDKLGLSLFFSAGIKAKVTEFTDLVVCPTYLYALTDLTRNDKEEYENVFGEKSDYKPTKYSQMGLRLGVILKL